MRWEEGKTEQILGEIEKKTNSRLDKLPILQDIHNSIIFQIVYNRMQDCEAIYLFVSHTSENSKLYQYLVIDFSLTIYLYRAVYNKFIVNLSDRYTIQCGEKREKI